MVTVETVSGYKMEAAIHDLEKQIAKLAALAINCGEYHAANKLQEAQTNASEARRLTTEYQVWLSSQLFDS